VKLFTKYNRINLLATIVIFLFASITFYIAIRYILIDQVDQDLSIEQHEIETYVKEHNVLPEPIPVKDQKITYATATGVLKKRKFKTIALADGDNKEKNAYRTLEFGITANGKIYGVSVSKSLAGTDDLITSILLISSLTILAMLIVSLLINRVLLKRLWKPFYDTLNTMKKFKLDKRQTLDFTSSGVEEFAFMNETLRRATGQAQRDYLLLKEFTENASHEMQTPLAIIRSKLDLLIQDLSEKQSHNVQPVYEAIDKLSRLTQSLLFLAKIENNQFSQTSSIDLKEKIEQKIQAFNELWQNKNISVFTSLDPLLVNMNNELVDTLLNNLFSNATRHNFSGGSIAVNLSTKHLAISNTSSEKELDSQLIFSRFYKQSDAKGTNGLGLSIIKQICDASGFVIHYSYCDKQHSFTVQWHNSDDWKHAPGS
jgi:signal transduction histidine kinase